MGWTSSSINSKQKDTLAIKRKNMFDKTENFNAKRQKFNQDSSSTSAINKRVPIHPIIESGAANRFQFESDMTINIYKRSFDDLLLRKVINLNETNYKGLFIYGVRGIGKSYSLYNLVLNLLQSNNNKVVYISDCKTWVNSSSPVDYLLDSLLVALYDADMFITPPHFECDEFAFFYFLHSQILPLIEKKKS